VSWSSVVRNDLARPERPTDRREAPFLIGSAVVVIAVAHLDAPGSAVELLLMAVALLGFALRGLVPSLPAEVFAAMVIVPVTLAVVPDLALETSYFLLVFMMLYTAWHLGSTIRAVLILVVAVAATFVPSFVPSNGFVWSPWTLAVAFMFSLGRAFRRQQELMDELEQAKEALVDQAVGEERRRMARELHDVAGHTLAAMVLHVTGARHVLRRDIDEAERALEEAEAVGRSSLDQIRAVVAALRTHERGTDPSLAGSEDLSALAEEYRRAGLIITSTVDAAGLDGPVGAGVYRIAREALANVARHAPRNPVELVLAADEGRVRLVVEDRGRPAAASDPKAGRFGLIGMRERALALGGELDAGPTAEGWRVELRLPATVTAASRDTAGAA
jgi:signal transduction histidine kinase